MGIIRQEKYIDYYYITMADSITYGEFLKKENKKTIKGQNERSPTATDHKERSPTEDDHKERSPTEDDHKEMSPSETETTLEDMQSTILQVQDNLQDLTNKTTQDMMICKRKHHQVKTSIHEYQQAMDQKIHIYEIRIEDLQTEVSKLQMQTEESMFQKQTKDPNNEDSDSSSVWEINSASSDSEN